MPTRLILSETGRSIGRNRTAFILATSVQAVCLTLLGIFFLVTFNIGVVARSAQKNVELHAFLADSADAGSVQDQVRCITGVASTEYVSKEQALARLQAELGEDSTVIGALGYNPLPASIRVAVQPGSASAAFLTDLETKISLLPGVTEVWSDQQSLARLDRLLAAAVWLGIAILVIVSLAVAFIVFRTVDTSISSRSREIEIMELVGASRSVVEAPFMIEGVLQGFSGGLCAFIIVLILARVAVLVLPAPVVPVPALLALNLGLGCLLGLIGSAFALDRIRK